MKINSFTQIEAWIEARQLVNQIYQESNNSKFYHDYGLKDQIQRASVSIMSNSPYAICHSEHIHFVQCKLREESYNTLKSKNRILRSAQNDK